MSQVDSNVGTPLYTDELRALAKKIGTDRVERT